MEHLEDYDTIVGQDVQLSGSLKNSGSILINGRVQGDVASNQSVVIGSEAVVEGPIEAENVQVAGTVLGAITAVGTLEMLPNSKVKGDIKAGTLHIQPGATFNGASVMELDDEAAGTPVPDLPDFEEADEEESTDESDDDEDEEEEDEAPASRARRKPKLELDEE
jgi:cytoskeletal protein CcmA (bactofilin family)